MEKKEKRKLRAAPGCAAALLAIVGIWLYNGGRVGTTELTAASTRVPAAFDGFRIAHISDLHNGRFGKNQQRLIDALQNARPDIIAITGDTIDSRRTDVDAAMEVISRAVSIAPVYYVTGNHEARVRDAFAELEARMLEAGVHVLRNEAVSVERSGETLRLAGLDDPAFYVRADQSQGTAAAVRGKLDPLLETDAYTVLLCHRPELFAAYCDAGIDLALCGHAHGGQFRIPFIGGVYAPDQGFWPKYTAGLITSGRSSMAVSRGLGNSLFPFRLNNPPELVIVTLKNSAESGAAK